MSRGLGRREELGTLSGVGGITVLENTRVGYRERAGPFTTLSRLLSECSGALLQLSRLLKSKTACANFPYLYELHRSQGRKEPSVIVTFGCSRDQTAYTLVSLGSL